MKRRRFTPVQIMGCLREAERRLATGETVAEICAALGIAEFTYYRWRGQYGQIGMAEINRIHDLEREVLRLNKIVQELQLDKQILKELLMAQRTERRASVARAAPHDRTHR